MFSFLYNAYVLKILLYNFVYYRYNYYNTHVLLRVITHRIKKGKVIMLMEELKTRSFRITDETADKIKEIANEISGNQQETISKLIETYEFQKGKSLLTEKKADIEQFERYISCLTNMYMRTLEDNENITSTVRTEFESLLRSKDTIIQDLQGKLQIKETIAKEALQETEELKERTKVLDTEFQKLLKETNEKIIDLNEMLEEKGKLNNLLTDSYEQLKEENKKLLEIEPELKEIQESYKQTLQQKQSLEKQKEELEKELVEKESLYQKNIQALQEKSANMLQETKNKTELEKEKLKLELEKEYQRQLQELTKQKQLEIDGYQKKYFELLEKMQVQKQPKRTKQDSIKQET